MTGPVSLFVPAALIAALSVPLALGQVPPNRYYGFRTAWTLAHREGWYRVNRVAGRALLVAVAVTMGLYVSDPELASGRSFMGVLALVVPLLCALAIAGLYARRIRREGD